MYCRAFRIGQSRDVKVYRFISEATVEENIYLRQVYKQVTEGEGGRERVERGRGREGRREREEGDNEPFQVSCCSSLLQDIHIVLVLSH